MLANHATKEALKEQWRAREIAMPQGRHQLQQRATTAGKTTGSFPKRNAATSLFSCTAAPRGVFVHTRGLGNVTARRRIGRTPLERRKGPIRVPQIGVSQLEGPILHAESLVEGPACGAQPGELEGCKSKRKATKSRRKNPSLPKCHQEQNHPDFCWCYFQQCARLNMCFR